MTSLQPLTLGETSTHAYLLSVIQKNNYQIIMGMVFLEMSTSWDLYGEVLRMRSERLELGCSAGFSPL